MGPALIQKGQSISLDVLTDSPPKITFQSDLAGVTVTEEKTGDALIRRWKAIATIAIVVMASSATGLLSHYLTSEKSGTAGHIQQGADSASAVSLVDTQTGNRSTSEVLTDPSTGGVRSIAYSPDGDYLATGDANGDSYIWSVATQRLLHDIHSPSDKGSHFGINAVAFSKKGGYFATGDANGTIDLWSGTFTLMGTMPDPGSGGVRAIAFSPDGRYLAAGDLNSNVYIWSTASRKRVNTLPDPSGLGVYAVAFSDNGLYMAAGDGRGDVLIWTHKLSAILTIPHSGGIRAVAFTSDTSGTDIAAGDANGYTYVWTASSGHPDSMLAVPGTYGVTAIAFSTNDQNMYLAVADADGRLYFWVDTPHGQSVIRMQSESPGFLATGALTTVAFSPDGEHLAAGASIGHFYQWGGDF